MGTIPDKITGFFSAYPKLDLAHRDHIITANDDITHIYFLLEGLVRQYKETENGEELTLHLFKPQSYFPTMLVLSDTPNRYNFDVHSEKAVLYKAPKQDVIDFLKEHPDVLFDLATRLSMGLSGYLAKIESLLFTDARVKVASVLVYLGSKYGTSEGGRIVVDSAHHDIASWTGIQRETVSRQIEKFEKEGLLNSEKNKIEIFELGKLREIAATD